MNDHSAKEKKSSTGIHGQTKVSTPTSTSETSIGIDHFNQLPAEIILYIFSFLSLKQLMLAAFVCSNMQKISKDNALWEPHCLEKLKSQQVGSYKNVYRKFSQEKITAKILVLGGVNSKKTRLLKLHVHGIFCDSNKSQNGVDFCRQPYTKNVTAQFWDISGQERFSTLWRIYFKESVAAIVVINMHNVHDFEDARNWINYARSQIENIPIAIIGTYESKKPNTMPNEVLNQFANSHEALLSFSVAVDDKNQIDAAFQDIIKALGAHYEWFMGPKITPEEPKTANRANCLLM